MSFEYLCRVGDVEETVMSVLIQLKSFKLESFIKQHRHFFQTGRAVVANDIIVRVCLATDQLQTKKCIPVQRFRWRPCYQTHQTKTDILDGLRALYGMSATPGEFRHIS